MASHNRITNHAGPIDVQDGQMLIFHYTRGRHNWIFRFCPSLVEQAMRSVGELVCDNGVADDNYLRWADAARITKGMRELVARCN